MNLLILAILIAGIPIAVQLARQQQILKSRAAQNLAVDFLTKDQGGTDCVTTRGTGANNLVATCKDVKLSLTGGVSGVLSASPSPSAQPSPSTPSTSPSPSASTPSTATGTITVSNPCTLGTANGGADATHCKATFTWSTTNTSTADVKYDTSSADVCSGTLVWNATNGPQSANWIDSTGYWFHLCTGNTHLSKVFVQGVAASTGSSGTITASPNPVTGAGSSCGTNGTENCASTTISWNTDTADAGQVYVSVNGAQEVLVWQNPSGSEVAPWINSGKSYEFKLYQGTAHQTVLGRVTVTRQ